MNIRTFCAPSVEAALAQVRRELGDEAVILSSREVPFAAPATRCEVMAARESAPGRRPAFERAPLARAVESSRAAGSSRATGPTRTPTPTRGAPAATAEAPDQATCLLELQLTRQEVDPMLAHELARRLRGAGHGGAAAALARLLRAGGLVEEHAPRDRVTVVVGGTGVGKTTTLAKLAARLNAAGAAPALLTCDTWRVAAVEQLAVFADLLGVPLAVAYTPREMAEAADRLLAEGHTLLVDTPGRAPRDAAGLAQLKEYLDALPERRTHLVAPAHLRGRDIEALVAAWQPLGFERVLLTKLDETTTCGALLTLLIKAQRPATWITFGQNVPDDLSPARASELATLILEGVLDVGADLKFA